VIARRRYPQADHTGIGPHHTIVAAVAVVGILEDTAHTDDSRHLVGLVCIVASCS
jgi:hypothetical protein